MPGATRKKVDANQHHGGKRVHEVLDRTPLAIPLSAKTPPSLNEIVARYVGTALAQQSEDDLESWDEANDFDDVDDDLLDMSPYELTELEPEAGEPPDSLDGPEAPGLDVDPEPPPKAEDEQESPPEAPDKP